MIEERMGAASISLWLPWAVHISEGVLRGPWLAGGFVLSGLFVLVASYRVRDEEIPRIALLSAAFFVATLMHLPLGPTRVHLLLNGLVGVVLGRRAPLAIVVGLALQAVLLGHGGFTTLGVNACVMTAPALLAATLFAGMRRLPWLGRGRNTIIWTYGCFVGVVSVLATLVLEAIVLLWGGAEDWHQIVWLVFYAHLPIVVLEGVVLGFTVSFLARVKPEMVGFSPESLRKWHEGSQEIKEANCTVHQSEPIARLVSPKDEAIRSHSPSLLLLIGTGLTLLFAVRPALAHNACADFFVLDEKHVQIDGWFDPGAAPMKGAKVQVFRPGQRLLVEGQLDNKGSFVFRFTEVEDLEVVVNGGAGHRASFLIPYTKLVRKTQVEPPRSESGEIDRLRAVAALPREHPPLWRERLKDALLGVTFLLSVAAFLLSWRTSRRLARHNSSKSDPDRIEKIQRTV